MLKRVQHDGGVGGWRARSVSNTMLGCRTAGLALSAYEPLQTSIFAGTVMIDWRSIVDAAEFRVAWEFNGDYLGQYPTDSLAASALPEITKHFLRVAGMPQEAAPFLSFASTTLRWLGNAKGDLNQLYSIGSDESGNPIVVDKNGVVWLIDHEMTSRRTFVNSSVPMLADCLLAYRGFVAEAVAIGGDDALLYGRISHSIIKRVFDSIKMIDHPAARSGSFWDGELSRLSEEAST